LGSEATLLFVLSFMAIPDQLNDRQLTQHISEMTKVN